MKPRIETSGGPEMAHKLMGMSDAAAGQALETSLVAGALPVVNRAKELAPVRTGNLRRSLHIGGHMEETPEAMNSTGTDIGGNITTERYAQVLVGTNVGYGLLREFGTARSPGTPFMRPAVEMGASEFFREVSAVFWQQIRDAK